MSFMGILIGADNNLTIKWHATMIQFNGGGTSTNKHTPAHILNNFPNIPNNIGMENRMYVIV